MQPSLEHVLLLLGMWQLTNSVVDLCSKKLARLVL